MDIETLALARNYTNGKIADIGKPMMFKGTLGTSGTITDLPAASTENEGFAYRVIESGTYAGQSAIVGDVFVSNSTEWVLIPGGDEVGSVRYDKSQILTDEQKAQARENIGAISEEDIPIPEVPTKTSDLINDSNFVSDDAYVHTDNNYSNSDKSKNDLSNVFLDLSPNEIVNIFSEMVQGSIDISTGAETQGSSRIKSAGVVNVSSRPNNKIRIRLKNTFAVTAIHQYLNGVWSGVTNLTSSVDGDYKIFGGTIGSAYDGIRIVCRPEPDGRITPEDVERMDARMYFSGQETAAPKKYADLTICSLNLGHYYYGGSTPGVPSADVETKKIEWRRTIGLIDADVIGCQEAWEYFDNPRTLDAYEHIWKNNYQYTANNRFNPNRDFGLALFSRYKIMSTEVIDITDTPGTPTQDGYNRHVLHSVINVHGKDIHVFICHLHNGSEQGDVDARTTQNNEIKSMIANKEYFVVCGDFNAASIGEFDTYKTNYSIANGDWFGTSYTYPVANATSELTPYLPLDNIITSRNIKITNFEVLKDIKISDHAPIRCKLEVCVLP